MQRLYSTFACGWPGTGLLCLRMIAAIAAFHFVVADILSLSTPFRTMSESVAGLLLCIGLWTVIAGSVLSAIALWSAFFGPGDFWAQLLLGAISAGLVMLGPGAWSIDARLFGRKRLIREQ